MSCSILLKGMRFFAYHGVLPEEKELGQDFLVDVEMILPEGRVITDRLSSTVDYSEVYAVVRGVVVDERFELIEALADRAAGVLLEKFPAHRVTVTVKKPQAPLGGVLEYAGAEVTRVRREEFGEPAEEGWGWVPVYLGLGSNLGDRQANLWLALGRLAAHPSIRLLRVSSFYETTPVGNERQGKFLNAAALVKTGLTPLELLDFLQEVEAGMGRERRERWGPRTIDLDILLYGEERVELPQLVIPHPLMLERDFVLTPLAEIAPRLEHTNGKTSQEILKDLQKFGTSLLSKIPGHVTI